MKIARYIATALLCLPLLLIASENQIAQLIGLFWGVMLVYLYLGQIGFGKRKRRKTSDDKTKNNK